MSDKMDFVWQTFDNILNKWILIVLEVYRYNQVNGGIVLWLFEEYLWYMNNDQLVYTKIYLPVHRLI